MAPKIKRKVLIVEDSPVTSKYLEKLFFNDGCLVCLAFDGVSAIQKAKEFLPHCILLDIIIPDMNGKEVAKKLYADPVTRPIPVVFLTATVDVNKDKGHEAIDIDGRSYPVFAKPIHERKILSVVRKTINRFVHSNKPAQLAP